MTENKKERFAPQNEGFLADNETTADEYIAKIAEKMERGEAISNEERVNTANEARERLGVELTPDDLAIPSGSCGGGR